ncbi:MAG: hypothetical protein Q4C73_01980 [Eubacteriales bacterium]|nr:hypothetical protein [Eubacteriales bacterium]
MNPMKLLQLKSAWDRFKSHHPRFPRFLSAARQKGISEGTVIAVTITWPDGHELSSNVRLNQDDIALFRELSETVR